MYLNEEGVWINKETGYIQDLFDYLKTKPYIPRIYDYDTKNTSFFNMHVLLKKLGIKNHNEHLQLFDPTLRGVDPYSPLLTNEVKMKIDKECRLNVWYFFREVVKVKINTEESYFDLNIGNYTNIWLMTRSMDFFFEQPRQTGKTYGVTTFLAYLLNFGGKGIQMTNVHYKEEKAKDNVLAVQKVLDNLPPYLQYHKMELGKEDPKTGAVKIKARPAMSKNSKKTLDNRLFDNIIKSVIVGMSEDNANNSGRGNTDAIIFIDEITMIKFNFLLLGSIGQANSTAKMNYHKAGLHHGMWMLGTPGFLNTPHGRWMYENVVGKYVKLTVNTLFIFDMTADELSKWRDTQSISTVFHIKYSYDLLGYDEEWLYEKARNESVVVTRREILLNWEEEEGNNPFSKSVLNSLSNKANTVTGKKVNYNGYDFLLYDNEDYAFHEPDLIGFLKYNFTNGIIVGIDVAYGYGSNRDSTAMVFIDSRTLKIVATFGSNTIDNDDLLMLLLTLMRDVKENNFKVALAIERNSPAEGIIAALKKIPQYQDYLVVYEASERKLLDPSAIIDTNVFYKDKAIPCDIGLRTTKTTRPMLMDVLSTLVTRFSEAISVPCIVNEIISLTTNVTKTTTKIEAGDGSHDDYVMAMVHGYFAIFNNAKMLKIRNHINIDSSTFVIDAQSKIVDVTTSKHSKRIIPEYQEYNGKIRILYKDIIDNKYVTTEEAKRIENNEKFNSRIRKRGETLKDYTEAKLSDNISSIKDNLKARYKIEELKDEEYAISNTFNRFIVNRETEYENKNKNYNLENNGKNDTVNHGIDNGIFDMFNFQR